MISIAVIEDDPDFKEILLKYLSFEDIFLLKGVYPSAEIAMAELIKDPPDIAIVDIKLPGMSGIEMIGKIKEKLPDTQFLACSLLADDHTIFEALKNGASGYLLKSVSAQQLRDAILELKNGGAPLSQYVAKRLITQLQGKIPKNDDFNLSKREHQILELMAEGLSYKEMAARLFISTDTIKNHIQNIYKKMHVKDKIAAINKFNSH